VRAETRQGRRRLVLGGAVLGLFAAAALLAGWIAPYDPRHVPSTLTQTMLQPPGAAHPFGTDALGRDLLSRVLWGGRVSLAIGIGVEIVAALIGVGIGVVSGYYGRWSDAVLMRFTDVVMAFPSLVLAIGLIAVFERPGLDKVALVLVALGWTTIGRVTRGEVLSLRERDYVEAARALGAGDARLIARHLLPNLMGPVIVTATIGVGSNMVAEAGLSFLGLGAQAPTISWGALLADGQTFLVSAPWVAVFPGLALLLVVLGINILGDGLRDIFDPRLRQ